MSDLIKISFNENEELEIDARELFVRLRGENTNTKFSDWITEKINKYGFTENVDFKSFSQKNEKGGRPSIEYKLTLNTAKEIAIVENNENGRKIRLQLIQIEKDYNSPEKVMARALMFAENQLKTLKLENTQQKQLIGELKPKADYTDNILKNKGLVTITAIAKDYGMSAKEFNAKLHELGIQYKQSGQWFLYEKYHDNGYTQSETIDLKHKDGTSFVQMNTKWTQKGRLFLYNMLKENKIVPMIER